MTYEVIYPFTGPVVPKKPNRVSTLGVPRYHRKKSDNRDHTRKPDLDNEQIPGTSEYRSLIISRMTGFFNNPGFPCNNRTGVPCGMRRPEAEAIWAAARIKAKEVIKTIMTKIELDPFLEASLTDLQTIALGPNNVRDRIVAHAQILSTVTKLMEVQSKAKGNDDSAESWLLSVIPNPPGIEVEETVAIAAPRDDAKE